VQLVILIIGALLFWVDAFYHLPAAMTGNTLSPLYQWMFAWSFDQPLVASMLSFFFVVATALVWHFILVNDGLLPRNTFMPALLTVMLLSYSPFMMRLNPVMPANLLLVLAIHLLLRSGPRDKAYQDIVSAGILLSLAALFNITHLVFIPLIWISFVLFRSYSLREWVISFAGIFTPLLYVAFVFFWNDAFMQQLELYRNFFRHFRFLYSFGRQDIMIWLIAACLLIFMIPAFFRFVFRLGEKLISIRKSSMLIVWVFLLGVGSLALIQTQWLLNGSVMLLPMSLFLSAYILTAKKRWFSELMLWLLLAALIAGKCTLWVICS
jgi:hypothetical protein